ncbi:MAG: NAD(P)/FAD-dependent oxidoreductase, partial [Sciscionella sp.]
TSQDQRGKGRYDVIVVGGGAAGLSAALMLGRACRSVLVIDNAEPRNAPAAHMHGFPSQDGTPPDEFLAATRDQLRTYDITVIAGTVRTVERTSDGFRVALASGREVQARRLLACSGITDVLPDVPGLRERWGREVVHCPYCHGWEVRGQRIGVLASVPMSLHQALLFRQWTDQLTLLLHTQDAPAGQQADELAARGIRIVTGEVTQVETADGHLSGVRLTTGEHVDLDVIAVAPITRPRADYLALLGLIPQPHPSGMGEHIPADPTGRTTVDGVWVAGNLTEPALNVLGSANSGAIAAGAINADLIAEDTERALRVAHPA